MEAFVHEWSQLGRWLIKFWRILTYYHVHCFERLHSEVLWLTVDQFCNDDSQGPNIDALIVILFRNKLRSHPRRCAYDIFAAGFFFGKLQSVPKITDFDLSFHVDENIIAFQISMYLPPAMNTCQSLEDLKNDVPNNRFWYLYSLIEEVLNKSC